MLEKRIAVIFTFVVLMATAVIASYITINLDARPTSAPSVNAIELEPPPAVRIGSLSQDVGEEGLVELQTFNISGLLAWLIDVAYDPAMVSVVDCLAGAGGICNISFADDTIRVVGARGVGLDGDVTLASITFSCGSTGSSALTLTLETFANAVGNQIDVAVENGSISCILQEGTLTPIPTAIARASATPTRVVIPDVSPTFTKTPITATLTPTNTPTSTQSPIPTLSLTPTSTSTHTPNPTPTNTSAMTPTLTATSTQSPMPTRTPTLSPTHTPINTHTPSPTSTRTPIPSPAPLPRPPVPPGDVNCDGRVNSLDALFVLQFYTSFITPWACLSAADVNEDGVINAIDALLILQFNAGFLDSLPIR